MHEKEMLAQAWFLIWERVRSNTLYLVYNSARISYCPDILNLTFLIARLLFGVLFCCTWYTRAS